jgi:hypothetical protein
MESRVVLPRHDSFHGTISPSSARKDQGGKMPDLRSPSPALVQMEVRSTDLCSSTDIAEELREESLDFKTHKTVHFPPAQ